MPYIDRQTIADVLHAASIKDVVASYLPLKKAGSGFKALCPFHPEKTPSFNVSPTREIFKCFGCGMGGNVVKFIMEMEKADYPGAIGLLADRYQIQIRYTGGGGGEDPVHLYRINEAAAQYFRRTLKAGHAGDRARAYLKERGVSEETSEQFGLGAAPAEWDALLKRLRAAGFSDRVIRRSGLVVEKEGSDHIYDRFRDRLMFPIRNSRGKVVAFGGRLLPEAEQKGGKYINSPETPIFRKSRVLYGQELLDRETERVVVVEGYFDVMLPWQHGLRGFVAPMGTAFGPDHAVIVRRYARRCTMVFDSDAAGRAASERSLDPLLAADLDISVAELPEAGEDPADVVTRRGPEALTAAIDAAPEMFDFLLERAVARRDLSRTAERSAVAGELLERIGQLEDPVRRDLLLQKVAGRLNVDVSALRQAQGVSARGGAAPDPAPAVEAPVASRLEKDVLLLIRAMLQRSDVIPTVRARLGDTFGNPAAERLVRALYALYDETGGVDLTELNVRLQDDIASALLADAQMLPEGAFDLEQELDSFAGLMQRRDTRRRKEDLRQRMRAASGEEKERIALELARLAGA